MSFKFSKYDFLLYAMDAMRCDGKSYTYSIFYTYIYISIIEGKSVSLWTTLTMKPHKIG